MISRHITAAISGRQNTSCQTEESFCTESSPRSGTLTKHTSGLLDQKSRLGEEEIGRIVMQQIVLCRFDGNGNNGTFNFAQWNERNYTNPDNRRRKSQWPWGEIELRAARRLATFDFAANHRGH